MTKTITKRLLLLLPFLAVLLASCDKTVSNEFIQMSYNTPENGVIAAEGGEIIINVESTHSFQMSSNSSAFSFFQDGLVRYDKDGVAIVETVHTVYVAPNETGKERELSIVARHLHNPEILSSLNFIQPAKSAE